MSTNPALEGLEQRLKELHAEIARTEAAKALLTEANAPSSAQAAAPVAIAEPKRRGRKPKVRTASAPRTAGRNGRETREEQTLRLVREHPGITASELQQAIGFKTVQQVYGPMRVLQGKGLVGNGPKFYPTATNGSDPVPAVDEVPAAA